MELEVSSGNRKERLALRTALGKTLCNFAESSPSRR